MVSINSGALCCIHSSMINWLSSKPHHCKIEKIKRKKFCQKVLKQQCLQKRWTNVCKKMLEVPISDTVYKPCSPTKLKKSQITPFKVASMRCGMYCSVCLMQYKHDSKACQLTFPLLASLITP